MVWRGSETSGVEAIIYGHGDDPIYPGRVGPQALRGRTILDEEPAIVGASWSKSMGAPYGSFQLRVKANKRTRFLTDVLDDDWVDLSFLRHDKQYHVCRGLIDTVRESTAIVNGATERVYNINGRDFGKIWEQTAVYFNRFIGENIGGSALLRTFAAQDESVFGDVAHTVFAFLRQFLIDIEDTDAGVFWSLPPGIPGIPQNAKFTDVVNFLANNGGHYGGKGYTNQPPRVALNAAFLDPSGNNLWNLAQQWSDPSFCELFTELVDQNTFTVPGPGEELRPEDAGMVVIVRDRPFPFGLDPRNDSGWFNLPLHELSPQDIMAGADIGRGGEERFNAFFLKGKAFSEYANSNVELTAPIVDIQDIQKHGFRRYDATSDYVPSNDTDAGWEAFIAYQRAQIADWHGLNAYLFNGTLPLARGFPEIRIGTRVRILGETEEQNLTFYVEGVNHTWSLTQGTKTVLTVTRGWRGTDDELVQAIVDGRVRRTILGTDFESTTGTQQWPGGVA